MPYWIYCDEQAQYGDLRRVQILTSDELSLRQDLRGPFDKMEDALTIAVSIIRAIADEVIERLRDKPPQKFAILPLGRQTAAE